MKDLIDEKNRQEKMKRSIIKYWNVSYGSPEAIGGEEEEKEREHAAGIYPQENHVYDEESELKRQRSRRSMKCHRQKSNRSCMRKMTDYRT